MFEIFDKCPSNSANKLFHIVCPIQHVDERLKVQTGRRGNERVKLGFRVKMEDEGKGAAERAGVDAGERHLEIAIRVPVEAKT